jgi:molybdate transport system ATP-binding protein
MSGAGVLSVAALSRQGDFTLDVAFEAGPGITALFGPSGAGKSTVLSLIAGLVRPDRGRIELGTRVLADTERGIMVPPSRRRIGLVFQDAQLFPHLTVRQNIAFGRWFAPSARVPVDEREVVDALGIGGLLGRRPSKLSGGERQRVALARALLAAPELLLLDEPLAALDDERRGDILGLIEMIRDRLGLPMLYVTHRVDEVRRLASTVVALDRGRVAATGSPDAVLGGRRDS